MKRIILLMMIAVMLPSQAFASGSSEVINNFAFNAGRIIAQSETCYFFSPFSIISAFGMAYAGAAGHTAQEMERALGFSDDIHAELGAYVKDITGPGQVSIANHVWLNDGLKLRKSYTDALGRYYDAGAEELDMKKHSSLERINAWVNEQTHGKIPSLLSSLDPATRMIITNAVYFNGEWQDKFDREITAPEKFIDGERESEVPMMKAKRKYQYGEFDGVKVVELPYRGRRLSMLAVLPPEDKPEALSTLDAATLSQWRRSLETYRVDLWLPKFRTEKSYQMADLFKSLGVELAFSDYADFSGISESESLKIDSVIHKTFIDVDEERTEAAAVTGMAMVGATMMPAPVPRAEFHATRPFTYFIMDDSTGTILFMGRQTF